MTQWDSETCRLAPQETAALNLLEALRWGAYPTCTACGHQGETSRIKSRRVHRCKKCSKQFTVLSGTCFQDSKLSYSTLLRAIILYARSNKSIRPVELQRELGISYKSAYVLHGKLWEAFTNSENPLSDHRSMLVGYWKGFTRLVLKDGRVCSVSGKGEIRDLGWGEVDLDG